LSAPEIPTWPTARLAELILELARASGIPHRKRADRQARIDASAPLVEWFDSVSARAGVESMPLSPTHQEVPELVKRARALVICIGTGESIRLLAIIRGTSRHCRILGPDLEIAAIPTAKIRDFITVPMEAAMRQEIGPIVDRIGGSEAARRKMIDSLMRRRLAATPIGVAFRIEPGPSLGVIGRCRRAGLHWQLAKFTTAYGVQQALWIISWWIAGYAAIRGSVDYGVAAAWVLVRASLIPANLYSTWVHGLISAKFGAILKERLLVATMSVDFDGLKEKGPSRLLARTLEAQVIETGIVEGAFVLFVALIDLMFAAIVLAGGALGFAHPVLLLVWTVAVALFGYSYYGRRREWAGSRVELTHVLVETMIGHRTRLAQQPAERRHEGEDESLASYIRTSRAIDRRALLLGSFPSAGWVVLATASLLFTLMGREVTATALAISLAGVLLGERALRKLSHATTLLDAAIAWKEVGPLLRGSASIPVGVPDFAVVRSGDSGVSMKVRDLVFRFSKRDTTVVRGWSVGIDTGDRLLLQGPSGSGKSTLVSLLCGLRRADAGVLLLDGVDQETIGISGWRRRVVAAPQFHENHIIAETFLFNLLMGRRWPPSGEDVREASAVCEELGLGELIERMPGGLLQFVGETGWQLSHGERSRVFLARTLLQHAPLVILDETFAALDPQTFRLALDCARRRAPALLVVAHP